MNPAVLKELGPLTNGLFGLIDDMFTTENERAEARLKVMALLSAENLGQMDVNKTEATHASMFVAGWRPAVGWICAGALAWQFLLLPMLSTLALVATATAGIKLDLSGLMQFNMSELSPILLGMLGLGAMRTYEKTQGVGNTVITKGK